MVTRVLPLSFTRWSVRFSGLNISNILVFFTDSRRHAVGTSTSNGSISGSIFFIVLSFTLQQQGARHQRPTKRPRCCELSWVWMGVALGFASAAR